MSLELKHVSHIYQEGSAKESYALRDICLNVNEGEFLGIAGHTGSGKSTLIQHFNGLLKPTSGEVIVDGVNINGKEAKKELKALRMQVGIVFQYPEYQLFEETVERDIAFGPRNLNLSDIEIQHRVTEAMDMLKLSKKLRVRKGFLAWATPCSPNIEQDNLAFIRFYQFAKNFLAIAHVFHHIGRL